jgi:hypothetical protein
VNRFGKCADTQIHVVHHATDAAPCHPC